MSNLGIGEEVEAYRSGMTYKGILIAYGIDYDLQDVTCGHFTTGIIMNPENGTISMVYIENITFKNPENLLSNAGKTSK